MSAVEATKPVEEPVVAPTETSTETPVVAESAPVETATTEPATTEASAVATETPAETTETAAVKEEVKPVEEGILGYKGPGLLKSFIFQKKFFWFGAEPVESKALSSYLRGEKQQELANKNVAWAASTGKGLLFFSKKASEKATPHGVFNLSEITDITEDGTVAFAFTSGGHKHIFEASTLAERDNWVSVLKAKSAEATELAPTVVESEEYKKAHTDLLPKAPVVAAAAAKEETKAEKKEEIKEEKKEAKEEKKEEKKEIKEEKKEEKSARKSRSASRKRASIFGGFNLGGKKEEKTEAPKEEAVVAAPTEEATAAPVEPVVAPETTEATPVVAEAAPVEKPVPVKRNSIFGNLKFGQNKEKKVEAEAPAVPAKDAAEPVSETAPVIPAVEASEPLATSVASPATVPTETVEAPVTNGETKVEAAPTTKSDKRKSSLPFFTKKEKVTSDEEGEKAEKPKSPGPFAKLRATVKAKSSPKAEKVADKPAETSTETPAVVEPTPAAEPVVSEPEPVVPQSTPQVAASA